MGKILVKASPQIQIGPDGKPQMYYNVGFGGRRGGGDGARGRTTRNIIGRYGGGALGALGGLAGESRSLGGFLSNLQVGAMQGAAAGGGLANFLTSRNRQKRADILEGEKQARARSDAEAQLAGEREMERRRGLDPADFSLEQIRDMPSPSRRRILPGIGRGNMTQFGHELAAYQTEQEAIAAEQAKREQKERTALERAGLGSDIRQLQQIRQMNNPQLLGAAERLAAGQPIAPTLGEMVQQPQVPQQVQQAAGFDQNDNTVNQQLNVPENRDNQSNSVEAAQAEVSEESQQGGGGEPTSTRMGRLGDREQALFNQFMQQREADNE